MLGYELKFRDKILLLPLEAGFVITRVNNDMGERIDINVGLYDAATNNSINWFNEILHLNDFIEISLMHIEHTSEPIENYDFHEKMGVTKKEADLRTLERFHALKKELEEGGLL